jgi:hypothetical protein
VDNSFGQRILGLSLADALAAERESGLNAEFAPQDAMTTGIVWASVAGGRIAEFSKQGTTTRLNLIPLSDEDRATLTDRFLLGNQQARGAWFLPDQANVEIGYANLPYHFQRHPRFASGIALEEKGKIPLSNSPETLYFWTVLEPLFDILYRPLKLRSTEPPEGGREEKLQAWQSVEDWYRDLGIQVADELAVLRHGGGWSRLRSAEQLAAKERLLLALDRAVTPEISARYRVRATRKLIERYYTKAKRGAPTMRQLLTKEHQPTLCAFFGGDWLAFLRYIGEQPHPNERIATALPEPRLYVKAAERVPEVAAQHGINPAEIERMLAAFWPGERSSSPVDQRVSALKRYWSSFDEIHARQAPQMKPLWGFVEEFSDVRLVGADPERDGQIPYLPGTHLTFLAADLLRDIDSLWGGTFLPSHPEGIATTASPYALMCRALGPALKFWHEVALTAWFLTEGPYSRTDMAGLAHHQRREIAGLEELGSPVDERLFTDLIAAEAKLGKPKEISERESHSYDDVTISVSTSVGTKRAGFEKLRDVITRHRRAWAERHLDAYLRQCWEGGILKAANEYNKLYEQKAKTPSLKLFARHAEVPTNHWFGGDVSALFAAFGEKTPVHPTRNRLLPSDIQAFMWRVFQTLGGKSTSWSDLAKTVVGNDRAKQDAEWRAHGYRTKLAELSVNFVQLWEAIGKPPTLKEFGLARFKANASAIGNDLEAAWEVYGRAVETSLESGREANHG